MLDRFVAALVAMLVLAFAMPFTSAHAESGVASFYGPGFCGHRTASGERFNCGALTAAHRSLPFGARILVSCGRRSAILRINDRGPFVGGRVLDVSPAAKRALGMGGLCRVTFHRI